VPVRQTLEKIPWRSASQASLSFQMAAGDSYVTVGPLSAIDLQKEK